jgi:hypothetical protein
MLYNTQNYWVFGLYPSSGILKTRQHLCGVVWLKGCKCSLVLRIRDDGQIKKKQ